jgi:tetratricopeptide (TPR) repeat protein
MKLAGRGRFEAAVPCFEKALEADAGDARLHLQHGLALSELGRDGEAVQALEKAAALDPASAVCALFLGVVQLDGGRPGPARDAFMRALELEPGNPLARSYAALSRWDLGERAEAASELEGIDFVHTPSFEAKLLARIEERLQALPQEMSLDLGDPILGEDGDAGGIWILRSLSRRIRRARVERLLARAAALGERGRHEKALACLERAREHAPGDEAVRERILGARQRVLKERRKRMKREGDIPDLLFGTGSLALLCGEIERGAELLGRWVEGQASKRLHGVDAFRMEHALRLLGQAELARNRVAEAERHIERLCALHPGEAFSLYLLGRCRIRRGNRRAAVRDFLPLLDWEPGFARFRLRRLARAGKEGGRQGAPEGEASGEGENMV